MLLALRQVSVGICTPLSGFSLVVSCCFFSSTCSLPPVANVFVAEAFPMIAFWLYMVVGGQGQISMHLYGQVRYVQAGGKFLTSYITP